MGIGTSLFEISEPKVEEKHVDVCGFCNTPLATAETHSELVANLANIHNLDKRTADALDAVDRQIFLSEYPMPYIDKAYYIGFGSQISAPHIHAYLLKTLTSYLRAPWIFSLKVLDVGSGSGYMSAVFAQLGCDVVGIEHSKELVESLGCRLWLGLHV